MTAVEPGAVVVVRFAGDGAERKLMADYAPLKRVAMSARVIDGKAVAAGVRERVAAGVREFAEAHGGEVPGLATVLVGDDPASHDLRRQQAQADRGGRDALDPPRASAETPEDELLDLVARAQPTTRRSTGSWSSCRSPSRSTRTR